MGQLTGQGGITCWRKICPLFEGTPAINVRKQRFVLIIIL